MSLDKYEAVIGLEVHAQLRTNTKMFCSCQNMYGVEPNRNICPVCTGQPGSLPVLNRNAVSLGIKAALATESKVHNRSVFARKNYFYPDLPKGYQISQYEQPFCTEGKIRIQLKDGSEKTIGITRIHFEEDAGKNTHAAAGTVVDLNRAGVPLIEIVSEPDMRTAEEAGQYLRNLRSILRYIGVCDGNLEEGSFRCDANVSVRPRGQAAFGTKVELKNINSFKFIENAIEYEIARQVDAVESGEKIVQQTRSWNSAKNISEVMRSKEEAHDYRYFPEPDLPVLQIDEAWISQMRSELPELPEAKKQRFQSEHQLPAYDAGVLTADKDLADYFEAVFEVSQDAKASSNWVLNELLGRLNASNRTINESPIDSKALGGLIKKVKSGEISGKIAKSVFEEAFETGKSPENIIKEKGLVQVSDPSQLLPVIEKVLAENPEQVERYKGGKTKLMGFFVGQVMKETKGQGNPGLVNKLLKEALDK